MPWHLHPIAEFPQYQTAWQELNGRCSNSLLLDPLFVAPLVACFAGENDRLAILGEPTQPQAMALLRRGSALTWQTFQPANAPLGLWLCDASLSAEDAWDGLLRSLPGTALLIGLTQLDPNHTPRPAEDGRTRVLDYIETPFMDVSGSFEAFWQARSKNLRHDIKRQGNRLQREGTETRLEVLTEPADLERAVADFSKLEMAGWKGKAGTAVSLDDPQGRFYLQMFAAFAAQQQAIAHRYFYGDQLVATDLSICRDGTMIVLKTAYDESQTKTSPAQLMRYEAYRDVFDSGRFQRVEFYGPVMKWHSKWTESTRVIYHVNRYRLPFLAALHARFGGKSDSSQ